MALIPRIINKQPTITKFTTGSGTYTTPIGCVRLKVIMVGGGGSGSGGSDVIIIEEYYY